MWWNKVRQGNLEPEWGIWFHHIHQIMQQKLIFLHIALSSLKIPGYCHLIKIFITYSSSRVFMTNKTPSGARKHRKVPNQELAKCFSSSEGLAQYCVNLLHWFTHERAAFCTEQCTTSSLVHNFEVSWGSHSHSLKNYGFQFGKPFSLLFACMHAHLKLT